MLAMDPADQHEAHAEPVVTTGRGRAQSLPTAPVAAAPAQGHHADHEKRRLSDIFLGFLGSNKPRAGSLNADGGSAHGRRGSGQAEGMLQGRRGSHQGSIGSGHHTVFSIPGERAKAGGVVGMRRHSFQVNPIDAQVLATYERVILDRERVGSETPAQGSLSDLGLPPPPPLKSGGLDDVEDLIDKNLPQLDEDTSEAHCIICLSKFTAKKPPVQIPCSAMCNATPVHARCIYEWKEQRSGSASGASGSCPLCRAPLRSMDYIPPDPLATKTLFMHSARRSFVSRPAPKSAGMVRCYIRVIGTGPVTSTPVRYELWLQAPTTRKYPNVPLPPTYGTAEGDQLLMTARRRTNFLGGGGSIVDISLDTGAKDFNRNGPNYVASVKGTLSGLDYTITAPCRFAFQPNSNQTFELGSVRFEQNRIGSGAGPRRISICLPAVREDPAPVDPWPPSVGKSGNGERSTSTGTDGSNHEEEDDDSDNDDMIQEVYRTVEYVPQSKRESLRRMVRTRCPPVSASSVNTAPAAAIAQTPHGSVHHTSTAMSGTGSSTFASDHFIFARNRKPYYLESIAAFSLDFYGRVTLPSNKNCLLTCEDANSSTATPESNILLFGKIGIKGRNADAAVYTLDFQWPLSPLQAFGIALASCDRKIACA